jgi:small subunit ribosomal protein S6
MRQVPTCNYEAMFLFPQSVTADLKSGVDLIKDVLTKNGATIIAIKKWGDRPLAYPIQKQKRGLYILCYFSVSTDKLGEIERAFNLSELVIRQLLLRADHLSMEEMVNAEGQADLTIEANLRAEANAPAAPAAGAAPAAAPAPAGAAR